MDTGRACPELAEGSACATPFGGAIEFASKAWETEKVMAAMDWSQCAAVESVPGKVSGAWVLRGTRMPVATIFENLEAGASLDDILSWFDGLDREQVKAVIDFAARSLETSAPTR